MGLLKLKKEDIEIRDHLPTLGELKRLGEGLGEPIPKNELTKRNRPALTTRLLRSINSLRDAGELKGRRDDRAFWNCIHQGVDPNLFFIAYEKI